MAVLMAEGSWWTAANKKAHILQGAARGAGYARDEGGDESCHSRAVDFTSERLLCVATTG